ncbi:MAG: prephenate dehydrogenase [Candidatus Competibacterales bacterium]
MRVAERLCIVGVGLIGGSLARALKAVAAVGVVVGAGRSRESLERAVALGVIDRYGLDVAEAVVGADVIVVAVPLGAVAPCLAAVAKGADPDAVITDVASAKGAVVAAAKAAFGGVVPQNFVPGHPIAGTEHSGVEASFAELFQGRQVILTPLAETSAAAQRRVHALWQTTGAQVVDMGVEHHDQVLAATSHLPHMLAYTLVDSLARRDERTEIFRYAAGGFRDFTRIASSDPTMWRDICLANGEALLAAMADFRADLDQLQEAIRRRDGAAIMTIFQRAKRARDNLSWH